MVVMILFQNQAKRNCYKVDSMFNNRVNSNITSEGCMVVTSLYFIVKVKLAKAKMGMKCHVRCFTFLSRQHAAADDVRQSSIIYAAGKAITERS
jgi:hypothetical protein